MGYVAKLFLFFISTLVRTCKNVSYVKQRWVELLYATNNYHIPPALRNALLLWPWHIVRIPDRDSIDFHKVITPMIVIYEVKTYTTYAANRERVHFKYTLSGYLCWSTTVGTITIRWYVKTKPLQNDREHFTIGKWLITFVCIYIYIFMYVRVYVCVYKMYSSTKTKAYFLK